MMQAVQPQLHLQPQYSHGAIALPNRAKRLLVIDDAITVPQSTIDVLGKRAIALSLSPQHNAIQSITDILRQSSEITCLHLFAQERDNQVWLGDTLLDAQTVERYSWDFQAWFSHLYSRALLRRPQIHVHCPLAHSGAFKLAVSNPLSLLTGADVIAA
jgi:hypothetical protein